MIRFRSNPSPLTFAYINYISKLILSVATSEQCSLDFYLDDPLSKPIYPIQPGALVITLQLEHVIAKAGGRSNDETELFDTIDKEGAKSSYLTRLLRLNEHCRANAIIDYSILNKRQILKTRALEDLHCKYFSVMPGHWISVEQKQMMPTPTVITSFYDVKQERRAKILNTISETGISINNIRGFVTEKQIAQAYQQGTILVNIRQTDHYHTLEELRILPAILQGCIVISEIAPDYQSLPYHESVIWSTYENIPKTVLDVSARFNAVWWEKFGNQKLSILRSRIKEANHVEVKRLLDHLRLK